MAAVAICRQRSAETCVTHSKIITPKSSDSPLCTVHSPQTRKEPNLRQHMIKSTLKRELFLEESRQYDQSIKSQPKISSILDELCQGKDSKESSVISITVDQATMVWSDIVSARPSCASFLQLVFTGVSERSCTSEGFVCFILQPSY
jgi:hypothetical protein